VTQFRLMANQALTKLGVISANETMSASDADLALTSINNLIDEWKAHSLFLYYQLRVNWNLIPGTGTYTIGASGLAGVNTPRPVYLDLVSFVDTTQSPPLEMYMSRLTDQAWDAIALKTLTSNLPTSYWYNSTYPLAELKLWPVPTQASLQGVLYYRAYIEEITSLDTDFTAPPAWRRMIIANLALELAPAFSRKPSESLERQAKESYAAVKRSNLRPVELYTPSGALIQTGNMGGVWDLSRFLSGP
jgi:hypothetical protein